jgi:hypothetical protein
MEARADLLHRLRERVPHLHLVHRQPIGRGRLTMVGLGAGIGGGIGLGVPLVVYDWARSSHSALEWPMAVTAWLFGLQHFARNGYHWWPIVIGALFLVAYCGIWGIAFANLADRVYHVRTHSGALALGATWSFVSFMFFWYMLLPIARDGAPFRPTAIAAGSFVAPAWVWIVGFTVFGLTTAVCYDALQARTRTQTAPAQTPQPAA